MECPFCGRMQTGRPIKRWKYDDREVSRYVCMCGQKFNFYEDHGKTWTVPKPKAKPVQTRSCKGMCKKFRVKKPANMGRYEAGQAHCQICDVWLDHKGAHVKDDMPATEKVTGWFCNCCSRKVRRKPRSKKAKEMLRTKMESAGRNTGEIKSRIPKQSEIILPILQICGDNKPHSADELTGKIADKFKLEDKARNLILRRNETVLKNKVRWSMFELRKAGLVTSNRGPITITKMGHAILKKNPARLDGKFLSKNSLYETSSKKKDNNASTGMDQMNKLITAALHMIKAGAEGVYLSDLKRTLKISDADKVKLLPRLARIKGISTKELRDKGELLDILLKYESWYELIEKDTSKNDNPSTMPLGDDITPEKLEFKTDRFAMDVLNMIKDSEKGVYQSYLSTEFGISKSDLDELVSGLVRSGSICRDEIKHNKKVLDILLTCRLGSDLNIDITYFDERRVEMIKILAKFIVKSGQDTFLDKLDNIPGINKRDMENEFNMPLDKMIDLAYTMDPPNKISMIVEFERIKSIVGRIPTRQDMRKYSSLQTSQYDKEFKSWDHMLKMLQYDPSNYDDVKINTKESIDPTRHSNTGNLTHETLDAMAREIKNALADEPAMANLFDILDNEIDKCNKTTLVDIIDKLE